MSNSHPSLALVCGVALLALAGRASAQSCTHPTRFATMCRYLVTTPETLEAEAIGRLAREGPQPHGEVVLRIDGQLCGSATAGGGWRHGAARARCVVRTDSYRSGHAEHVAEAEFFGLSDAEPASLDITLQHHGGLLSLPLEERALAPAHGRRKWWGLFAP